MYVLAGRGGLLGCELTDTIILTLVSHRGCDSLHKLVYVCHASAMHLHQHPCTLIGAAHRVMMTEAQWTCYAWHIFNGLGPQ